MANWPRDRKLRPDQRGCPIVWLLEVTREPPPLPIVTDADLEPLFGPGKSRRFKTWGHPEGAGSEAVHWLGSRQGTTLHHDPAYLRYTHHLIVRNDGWRIRGVDDSQWHPPMAPGAIYCLDTWSPHQVVDDPRLIDRGPSFAGRPRYKIQAALDSDCVHSAREAATALWHFVMRQTVAEGMERATMHAPRPKRAG